MSQLDAGPMLPTLARNLVGSVPQGRSRADARTLGREAPLRYPPARDRRGGSPSRPRCGERHAGPGWRGNRHALRALALKLRHFVPRFVYALQAQLIDEIERGLRPFVSLMLLVRAEDQMRDGARVTHPGRLDAIGFFAESRQELLADNARHARKAMRRILQEMQNRE